jgi:hypothetical protein
MKWKAEMVLQAAVSTPNGCQPAVLAADEIAFSTTLSAGKIFRRFHGKKVVQIVLPKWKPFAHIVVLALSNYAVNLLNKVVMANNYLRPPLF